MKDVRWRVALTLAIVGLSVWAFYPPDKKINLGLDLKGGVHLVLRVQTDDALRSETETTVERLRDNLTRANVQYAKLDVTTPDEFRIDGVSNEAAMRDATGEAEAEGEEAKA